MPHRSASLLLALTLALPAQASAYDTQSTAPLHQPRSGVVVGQLAGASPSTMRFRDATHAAVTFSTSAFEIRGEIVLAEGEVLITSTQHMVLTGAPFRIEVAPATPLHLVDGLRHEVNVTSELMVDGLDLAETHLRVASEEALPMRDTALLEACQPVHLWAEPRVGGQVIRTQERSMVMHAAAENAPGWSEVWLMDEGIWLRGYTWEAVRCGGGLGVMRGVVGAAQFGALATETLQPNTRIATSAEAPWTVQIHEAIPVRIVPLPGHTYFEFPLTLGSARIEGVVLR